MIENDIGKAVVTAAIQVHRNLGPGPLGTVYEVALVHELTSSGLAVERQVPIPIEYKGISFEEGFRANMAVEGRVILEPKSAQAVSQAHAKQVQTYLRLTGMRNLATC